MANDWQIVIGGKPFSSIPPYTVIAFELTILFGGLMTLLGLLVVGKLPSGSFGKHERPTARASRPRSSAWWSAARSATSLEVDALLRDDDAKEVTLVEP